MCGTCTISCTSRFFLFLILWLLGDACFLLIWDRSPNVKQIYETYIQPGPCTGYFSAIKLRKYPYLGKGKLVDLFILSLTRFSPFEFLQNVLQNETLKEHKRGYLEHNIGLQSLQQLFYRFKCRCFWRIWRTRQKLL